ncbi:Homeodomain-like DNA binding domain-containing transcription factor [Phycomyces blakesleeanus NRRL 1555(-)]|uniref:Homeodomain-like DNA binding domain-containing transcription factor n=1 Tax=Phycomyces blakesleeanus (strain ATCC 8743b / DSM 1359 / FGSC 10004 / NBRC 33097 / NRRL 1555) TaxID=763407 RepID=A0A162UQ28_PHYB8|nr:Homeodomain-like DNA binding domain-containing transcription factor [Phycomyces blakesleeanus NRRL 1555(-)]OAD77402.1 Homeodomain-like DNA binding domain-containing transcription factor [Phycomyces blakesleeanus NRRL 1555(-)]|eukprot:XP_018295442.1 Homeodomain-like DNA binding domain-containing transcription factor [Phycomyces blakesleeanus NRRL 1555(-)]
MSLYIYNSITTIAFTKITKIKSLKYNRSSLNIKKKKKKKLSMSNPQLAEWAKETFGFQKALNVSTISKILKRGDQGLIMQANQIEEAVILLIKIAENNQIPITWELIKTKATIFAKRIGVKDFNASQG